MIINMQLQYPLSLTPDISSLDFDINDPSPLSPLASFSGLERYANIYILINLHELYYCTQQPKYHYSCYSNPLVRGTSDVSVTSDPGAHFIPFGRTGDNIQSMDTQQQNMKISDKFTPTFEFPSNIQNINIPSKIGYSRAPQQLSPVQDVETDIDDQTITTATSSQITSSNNNNNDNNLNFNASEFVPQCAPARGINIPQVIVQPNVYMMPQQQQQMQPNMYNNNNNYVSVQLPQPQQIAIGPRQQQQPMTPQNVVYNGSRSPIATNDEYIGCPNEERPMFEGMDESEIIKMNPLLEDLLANDQIIRLMKHQSGSRYLQEELKRSSDDLRIKILRHIIFDKKAILSLSEDIYGNYPIQIFFENGTREDHYLLIQHLLNRNVYRLSRSFYGCRVVQAAFDWISYQESIGLVLELKNEGMRRLDEAIVCGNANHVIQKILSLKLPIEDIQFIIDCIESKMVYYSSHIFGCRIVQNIINFYYSATNCKLLSEMVTESNLMELCQSQYGNYVIQHILNLPYDYDEIKQTVIYNVFGNVLFLSKNKYGSNVVEKCLPKANDKDIDYLLDIVLFKEDKSRLTRMVKHRFANYVISSLLECGNVSQQYRLMDAIECDIGLSKLRSLNYGKHIAEKMKKIKQKSQVTKYYNRY